MKKLIIASTSTLHGGNYLEYILPELTHFFEGKKSLLFIPYARPGGISHDEYTAKVREAFSQIGMSVSGLHEYGNLIEAIKSAEAIFTGGGNTFLLVSQLYKFKVMDVLAETVKSGTPYLGSSAGSNITGLTMQTTNDMPIIYPPDFRTLGLIPFNLNPHYLDADLQSKHMGETRETRIKEFHQFNSIPVLGLREGSWLEVKGETIILKGDLSARLFRQGKEAEELAAGSDVSLIGR
ncbi:dipeptidase PepE [Flavobacterium sp. MAH-1]|uniref:dipeptidase E n=1 Tax=Flavobacterium agri TaxID=2743471 RepID=A0A7Y9C5W8_9FLAO|nr:dipeptidase PepE [Flavobacterium agri]NUY81692.1 dipeptidase PepE [Flavobacterium agri]NYA71716.1 dipeptidase PepE [Flavobacterium agri]